MKNFVMALASLLSIYTMGQEQATSPWSFGLKAGLNIASVKGNYINENYVNELNNFVGIHGGGWVKYQLDHKFSIQSELLGSLQGGDLVVFEVVETEARLPYILFPISVQYKVIPHGYLEVGPQLNLLLKEAIDVKAMIEGNQINEDEVIADQVYKRLENSRRFDVGLNIGAGYEIYNHWSVYTRYTLGLVTVDDREEDQRDLKNRVFAFGVSYGF